MNYYCAFYTDKYNKRIKKFYVKNKKFFRNLKDFERFFPNTIFFRIKPN